MTTIEFLRPRLCGKRFDGAAIPLDVLTDLAVIEEMVIEIAKWCFLQDHPDRARSPRGFAEGIELKLTEIGDGSAVPVIALVMASRAAPAIPPENQKYLEKAREAIVGAVAAAEQNQRVLDHLPGKCLAYFDRLGRSLRDGEAIEFATATQPTPARLTKETRRRLLAASSMGEVTEDVRLRGVVVEFDEDHLRFELQVLDGPKVPGPIATQYRDTLLEALSGCRNGVRVLLQGIGRFDRRQKLKELAGVGHVSILDPLDVPARLAELNELENGWLHGHGLAPPREGLLWLANKFDQCFPAELPLPYAYPTPEGGMRLEWTLGSQDVSLEIDLATRQGDWHVLNQATDATQERSLDLNQEAGWDWLAKQLRGLVGGTP